jgi:O-antigen ligase
MRKAARVSLLMLVFAIAWEYSLDWGAPFGNVARVLGLMTLLVSAMAIFREGHIRKLREVHWLILALYVWFCLSYFWTVVPQATLAHLRGYVQEMMLAWLVWEFAESAPDVRNLMRAWLAGSWVLAILTFADFVIAYMAGADQVRFAAIGQDPNDVARFLDFGFPLAALLLDGKEGRIIRALALVYFPVGFACVLLTASRSGLVVAMVALAGCAVIASKRPQRRVALGTLVVVGAAALVIAIGSQATVGRLGTVTELWQNGDLNQRVNIWSEGWRAFERAPIASHGAGSFVTAAGLAAEDSAHNTVLAILVESGLCGLVLATAIVLVTVRAIGRTSGELRLGLSVLMVAWGISSLVGTVGENRTTWLLLGIIAVSQRVAEENPVGLEPMSLTVGWRLNLEAPDFSE